jgi:hypothetical protein
MKLLDVITPYYCVAYMHKYMVVFRVYILKYINQLFDAHRDVLPINNKTYKCGVSLYFKDILCVRFCFDMIYRHTCINV